MKTLKHRPLFLFAAAALLTLFTASTLRAQTNLFVGSNSSMVSSNFTSGTRAYTNIFVGFAERDFLNTLTIVNDGTFLTNRASVYVGNGGSGNRMVINSGGKLRSIGASYVGFSNTANNNEVLVTGAGSVWTNGNSLRVGQEGSGNRLFVSDGGRVANTNSTSTFHIGFTNTASNNSVLVTGTGSILTNRNELRVGNFGSGNSLSVSNGGTVLIVGSTSIGFNSGASSNSVLVTGTDSRWTNSGSLRVGGAPATNSGWNSLVVSNGGGMEVGGTSEIGANVTSSNNSVLVTGAGSSLTSRTDFIVGNAGDGNSMVISNGGTVAVGDGVGNSFIGFNSVAANNSVLVTGANSLLTNADDFYVGYEGEYNSLTISNGGKVAGDGYSAIGFSGFAANNSVLVTGANSLLTNSGYLYVGFNGSGNSLVISNGGSVAVGSFGYVGYADNSANNSVTVSGTNSSLAVTNGFFVGYGGSSNSLSISDGASVTVVGTSDNDYFSLGETGTSSGNTLTVSGASTLSVNVATNRAYGIWIADADGSSNNAMVVSSGGKVYSSGSSSVGGYSGTGNSALITGAGSLWTNNGVLFLGTTGEGILTVADGGAFASTSVVVATDAGSIGTLNIGRFGTNDAAGTIAAATIAFGTNATAGTGTINFNQSDSTTLSTAISGNGSVNQLGTGTTTLSGANTYTGTTTIDGGQLEVTGSINSGNDLNVGYSGEGNSLVVSAGGTVQSSNGYIGRDGGASNNSVLVTGANSAWTNSGSFRVGNDGTGNSLVISNGGTVATGSGFIGNASTSSNNSVLVTGTDSLWTNSDDQFYVGNQGSGNSLVVSNGGRVLSGSSYMSFAADSSNNSVHVTGAGSSWILQSALGIGVYGAGNTLTISDGASVSNAYAAIGVLSSAYNNSVLVTGSNSTWRSSDSLAIGGGGLYAPSGGSTSNSLTISNGASVYAGRGFIGSLDSSNNSVLVTGAESLWSISTNLVLGYSNSSRNSLVISNEGTVANVDGYIGYDALSANNSVLVTGTDSLWTNSGDLNVGHSGAGNSLVISDGGAVQSSEGFIGREGSAANNSVLVTGTNSLWTNSGGISVGQSGSGNSLVISNGGTVATSLDGGIGVTNTASNNSMLVTGTGSVWTNSGLFGVGVAGSGNSLVISNGGTVAAPSSAIGAYASSSNNNVLVTGANSLWTSDNEFLVGYEGSGNSLVISNGGAVVASSGAIIGASGTSSNNSVLVTGADSLLYGSSGLFFGYGGSDNSLVISDGGTVVTDNSSAIGFSATSSNNSVLVTGANSRLFNLTGLAVGYEGSGSLTVANGGSVAAIGIEIASAIGSSGTLNIGSFGGSDTAGTIDAPTIAFAPTITFGLGTGAINFNQSNSTTISAAISGNGSLNQLGTGTTILSASNSYSGGTWISGGTLTAGNLYAFGTGAVTIGLNTFLDMANYSIANTLTNNGGTILNAGTISGGDFSAGTTDLSGNNSTVAEVSGTATVNVSGSGTTISNVAGGTVNVNGADTTIQSYNGGDVGVDRGLIVAMNDGTSSGVISGNGGMTKSSAGTLTLGGVNTYTGATTVGSGLLVVNGSIASSPVTIQSGGTLSGSGTVGDTTVQSGGTINPGNSPGTLNINGDIDWLGGGNYNWQIAGVTGTAGTVSTWDLVSATGVLDLTALTTGSQFNINLWSLQSTGPDVNGNVTGFDNTQGYTWKIATAAGGISGFTGSSQFDINIGAFNGTGGFANALNGGSFSIAQSLDGKDLNLVFTAAGGAPVPEPGTWAAAALLAGAAFMRWRKRKQVS
jgi:T5SS/PEP-CTERM-associated repeat protein/autotransporter-associated beta strand protein